MHTNAKRHGLRFALTTALVFIAGQLFDWQSAYLAAVFTSILLENNTPPSIKGGLVLFSISLGIYIAVYIIFTLLLPYPFVFFAALIIALAFVFLMSVTGKSSLLVTMALFAVLIIPYLATTSISVAWTQALWIPLNLGVAFVATWCSFAIISPVNSKDSNKNESTSSLGNTKQRFIKSMVATTPFVFVFVLIDGDHLLTLLYFGLFANQLLASNTNAIVTPRLKLFANLGAVFLSIVAYELMVIAPMIITMVLVIVLLCSCCGWWLISGLDSAVLARSALTGSLILLGDIMSPISDTVEFSSVERVYEVCTAVILVTIVVTILDHLSPDTENNSVPQHDNT